MGIFTPDVNTLRELYVEQLKKALNMERQIVEKGLPSMIEHSTSPELANAFRTHLEESRQHVSRLEQILTEADGEVSDSTCKVISALISEGGSAAGDAKDTTLRDVVLIAAGNQVEHHEIAVYGTLATWADILGEDSHVSLLEQTLEEEKNADELLTSLSAQINVEAPVA
ncbi:MAG TPA: ferritin-like domain-containing protein [Acidobacteriaceae bacterium]